MGYSSRGCIRQCKFCINQHCIEAIKASPINEFLNTDRSYICLLDDNVLACKDWKEIFDELNATGKTFEFKQGLDIRALTEEKVEVLVNSKINTNTLYFAFDSIKDKEIIEEKLKLWRQHYRKNTHMYVLCGFDENNIYDEDFWAKDIASTLERISICIKYGVFPYIMRFRMWNSASSPYRGMYINLSAWCNQKSLFAKSSLNEWANNIQKANEKQLRNKKLYSSKRYLMEYAGKYPELAYQYFDMKYNENNEFVYVKDTKIEKTKKENVIAKSKKNILFSIQHNKNSIKVNKIDKTRTKIKPIIEKEKSSINKDIKLDNKIDISTLFTNFIEKFKSGIITCFHEKL